MSWCDMYGSSMETALIAHEEGDEERVSKQAERQEAIKTLTGRDILPLKYHDDLWFVWVNYGPYTNDVLATRDPVEFLEEISRLEELGLDWDYDVVREGGPYA